jgi:hypothetical protein
MSRKTEPSLALTMRESIRVALSRLPVAIPARIISYDADKQSVDVQPSIEGLLPTEEGTERYSPQIVQGVPVAFPQGGGYFMSFPLKPGDSVLLVFQDRSLDEWVQRSSGVASPRSVRIHAASDAIAIPGVRPFVDPLSDADDEHMAMGRDGGAQVHIRPDRVDLGSRSATDWVALAGLVLSELQALQSALNGHISAYNTHTHVAVLSAASIDPAPPTPPVPLATPAVAPSSVAASNVRAD